MVENRGPPLQAVCAMFVSMAFVATMLRVYVRLRIIRAFGWDDAWMVSAMLTHIMFATCAIGGIHYGTGRHAKDLTEESMYKALRYWWLCYIAYCFTMISAKISIGLFLLRVAVRPLHRKLILIVMGLTVLTGVVFFFVTLLQCTPVSYFWDRSIEGGKCVNVYVIIGLTYLYSAISAICDFTFGILPIFMVWNLNMARDSKMMLIPILSMACIASTAVIVRMAFVMDFRSDDFLYDTVDIAIWSDVEQGLAVTAGSLATLRPLYRIVAKRLGISQSATNQLTPGRNSRGWYRSSSNNKPKRSGPFSLMTFTRHNTRSGAGDDDDYALENARPVKLMDESVEERGKQEKNFTSWSIQGGEGGSEEELNKRSTPGGLGGITRQTDVFLERSHLHGRA
ncbi:hypothetical protein K458DRAFT_370612 [Lentithecium fluviatile CBS 122367]|uniref:Rhodopsin domain-containing protein n=1 Tax=Lentithecium fluviatile CBS 122367 TaxID=1168545 RepID=A0A6G1IW07_9PLEO|nr:hypothetical protein K458DRAFT_370612 [Lentithecium fluviatile CBS 122367]